MRLSLLYDSAERLGADAAAVFREAAALGRGEFADLILGFAARAPQDRAISAMGYRAAEGPEGFRYEFV